MKKSKKNYYKKLYNKCWTLMSLWTRTKEVGASGYINCVSCGALKPYKEMHAGHYFHGVLDFDEMNINPQCVKCNNYKSGNLANYGVYLIRKYGQAEIEKLFIKSKQFKKYTIEELEEIKKDLEKKLKQPKELCL